MISSMNNSGAIDETNVRRGEPWRMNLCFEPSRQFEVGVRIRKTAARDVAARISPSRWQLFLSGGAESGGLGLEEVRHPVHRRQQLAQSLLRVHQEPALDRRKARAIE